eukprot:CAMPEP_0114636986 /NCGR_PEP_ID=MMETSP0168-20121206/17262_1 /TAXON_ID=95228 ORGANISM="Vannella sp., Strain DIVA3 517/6/12" /NCGR_SAMPLE_ID=MMETSP0168 /ASSEMBLY_ACC=CAM_ASM_000044 /LENGTH=65 /DNA_ID=CAMNT_0001848703 /DNA_START=282 /DNA_END=479 /DNA_ORIENTATION=+
MEVGPREENVLQGKVLEEMGGRTVLRFDAGDHCGHTLAPVQCRHLLPVCGQAHACKAAPSPIWHL